MEYRVDNIPISLRLPFWIYANLVGVTIWLLFVILRYSCSIRIHGESKPKKDPHIFAIWHYNSFSFLVVNCPRKLKNFSIINHAAWYMKHVHILLKMMGVEKIHLGSSGDEGKQAVDKVVQDLRNGFSTFINPDGPGGPSKVLKKGVLFMSSNSEVPIFPVRIQMKRFWELPGAWDKKQIPLPFSKIDIFYEDPISVSSDHLIEAKENLTAALGD